MEENDKYEGDERRNPSFSNTQLGILIESVNTIKRDLTELKNDFKKLDVSFVTKPEFAPVKNIVYGLMSVLGVSILVAIVKLVVK